jgi:hypothetical protein
MALLGKAALAMWWDIAPAVREDFEHWHSHEHFPERLAIPGFRRASRWHAADGGEGVFVLYEVDDHDVLASPAYVARLDAPSPWSTRLMPEHRRMVRTQCHVATSHGFAVARFAETLRLSASPGRDLALREAIGALGRTIGARPGLVGLHLLHHEAPALGATLEQRLRGMADASADHVVVAVAYDGAALSALAGDELGDAALGRLGAVGAIERGRHVLAASATPQDIA